MRLTPVPQSIESLPGKIASTPSIAATLAFTPSHRFRQSLNTLSFLTLQSDDPTFSRIKLSLSGEPTCEEHYQLAIEPEGISLHASTETGLYRGLATLQQLLQNGPKELSCLRIDDQPDLKTRGYMLDISRCKVPTLETLYELIDRLASLKYNQFQLYTEHVFAYRDHSTVWENASPLSAENIQSIDTYCHDRYIELVPNQNSFGHMDRWLRHDTYKALAECPDGYKHPILGQLDWGGTLKPNQASLDFVSELYDELLPNFRSKQLNIGGDEPWELGQGWSAEAVQSKGKHRVYLDHLLRLYRLVAERGKTMQFWGDIILESPAFAKELPTDTIGLIWGYEADHPFEEQCAAFKESGIPFYVAPGTSAWNTIGGRYDNAASNIQEAVKNALRSGAEGLLLTDWGDFGHHHSPPISYPAIVRSAALSWNASSNDEFDDIQAVNTVFFNGESPELARAIRQLGKIPNTFSHQPANRTLLNDLLFANASKLIEEAAKTNRKELESCRTQLLATRSKIENSSVTNAQSEQAKRELLLATDLLIHATEKGLAQLAPSGGSPNPMGSLLERFEKRWLERNRPGGLEESLSYLEKSME